MMSVSYIRRSIATIIVWAHALVRLIIRPILILSRKVMLRSMHRVVRVRSLPPRVVAMAPLLWVSPTRGQRRSTPMLTETAVATRGLS
jgi:hypothetical protein